MDPGNWATDIQAGAAYGYTLMIAVLLSSVTAMFLQFLALKLGVATERDLAQACRDSYHPKVCTSLCALLHLSQHGIYWQVIVVCSPCQANGIDYVWFGKRHRVLTPSSTWF